MPHGTGPFQYLRHYASMQRPANLQTTSQSAELQPLLQLHRAALCRGPEHPLGIFSGAVGAAMQQQLVTAQTEAVQLHRLLVPLSVLVVVEHQPGCGEGHVPEQADDRVGVVVLGSDVDGQLSFL